MLLIINVHKNASIDVYEQSNKCLYVTTLHSSLGPYMQFQDRDRAKWPEELASSVCMSHQEKKEEIWLRPMTKVPTPTYTSKKQRDKNATKTLITQRLGTDLDGQLG